MILTRRKFLTSILPAAAAIAVAPTLLEELLSTKTYFLPPAEGWSVNSLGGYLYSRQLSKILRQQLSPLVRFREFAEVSDPPGKFEWDVYAEDKTLHLYGEQTIEVSTPARRGLNHYRVHEPSFADVLRGKFVRLDELVRRG